MSGTAALVAFVRARLDEDERTARTATPGPWEQSGIGDYGWTVSFSRAGAGVDTEDSEQGRADADHIARHDPAHTLRRIAAQRAILDAYEAATRALPTQSRVAPHRQGDVGYINGLWFAVEQLAAAHADHPDYQSQWGSAFVEAPR